MRLQEFDHSVRLRRPRIPRVTRARNQMSFVSDSDVIQLVNEIVILRSRHLILCERCEIKRSGLRSLERDRTCHDAIG